MVRRLFRGIAVGISPCSPIVLFARTSSLTVGLERYVVHPQVSTLANDTARRTDISFVLYHTTQGDS